MNGLASSKRYPPEINLTGNMEEQFSNKCSFILKEFLLVRFLPINSGNLLINLHNSFYIYMSAEEIVNALIEEGFQDQDMKEDLIQAFADLTKADILHEVLMEVGDKLQEHIQVIKDLANNQKIRQVFIPQLHYWMIRLKLSEFLEIKLDDAQCAQAINEEIKKNINSIRELIKGVGNVLGEDLDEESITMVEEELNKINFIFEELCKNNEGAKKGSKDQEDQAKIQMMLERATYKNNDEYLKELEKDIADMPDSVIDRKIREIEIALGRRSLEDPSNKNLTQSERQEISKTNPTDSEGKSAKQKILSGEDVQRNLKILRNSLCGIDIFDIIRMIEKGRELKTVNLAQLKKNGKKVKVILLFGLSKAGKTTLITRMLGYKMKKMKVQGIYTIQAENPEQISQKHQQLVIGYSNKSTTRYPSIFEIPADTLPKQLKRDKNCAYYLMDSAGLEDSAGSEVEASNRISMIQFLMAVDNISIAVVINQKNWGVRGGDIEKLAATTSSIIRNLPQIRESMKFVFNNFDKEFKETFHSNVVDLYKNIQSQSGSVIDENFKTFFEELQYQSQNQQEMFCVDPLEMDPTEFIKRVWEEKLCIKDTSTCFISDIGIRAKTDIKKLCERCKKQFKVHYEKNDIKGAEFYIRLLRIIDSEPKLESGAEADIISMKNTIEKEVRKSIEALNKNFEEMQMSFIKDETTRKKKLEDLYSQHEALKLQIQRFSNIEKSESLEDLFTKILEESFRRIQMKMQGWEKCAQDQDLIDETINAISFYEKFGTEENKKSFITALQNKSLKLIQEIKKQIREKKAEHQLDKQLKRYCALEKVFGREAKFENLISSIEEQLNNFEKKITFIDLKNPDLKKGVELSKVTDEEKQVKRVEEYIRYIQLLLCQYPPDLTSGIKDRAKKAHELIVVKIPKEMMKKFQEMIKQNEEQEEVEAAEEDEKKQKNASKDKLIEEVKELVKCLKFLDKIEAIKKHHEGKLTEQFEGLEIILEISMNRFMKISEAFNKNDSFELKKYIKKMKSQFKQLENMIEITESITLKKKFEELKENLRESIANFIALNDCTENIGLKTIGPLLRLLEKLKKLKQFLPVANILTDNQGIIKENMTKMENKLFQPIQNLKKQMIQRQIFYPRKIQDTVKYFEELRNQSIFTFQPSNKIYQKENQVREIVREIYDKNVQGPLKQILKIIEENMGVEPEKFEQLQKEININTMDKYRRSLQLLSEIIEKPEIKELYFNDADCTWDDVMKSLRNFKDAISDKLDFISDINILERLKRIVSHIKTIENKRGDQSQNIFDGLYETIRQKYKSFAQNDVDRRNRLLKAGNDPENFDYETFRDLYKSFLADKTQNGQNNRIQLQEHFKGFRIKTQKKLDQIKHDMIDDSQSYKSIKELLKVINRYMFTKETIFKGLNQENFFETNLTQLENLLNFVGRKLVQLGEPESLMFSKNEEIAKKIKDIKIIELEIDELKDHKIMIPIYEDFLKNQGFAYLSEIIVELKSGKSKFVSDIRKNKNILKDWDEKCEKFFQAETRENQEIIKNILLNQIQIQVQLMKQTYVTNLAEYQQIKDNLQANSYKLPIEIKQKCENKLHEAINQIQIEEKKKFGQISGSEKFDFINFLQVGMEYEKSKNMKKIDEMNMILVEKERTFPEENLQFWRQNLADNKSLILAQNEKIQRNFQKLEMNLFNKIKKTLSQKGSSLIKYYKENSDSIDINELDEISQIHESRNGKWNNFLTLCVALKQIKDDVVFQASRVSMEQAKNKITKFAEDFKETANDLFKNMEEIRLNPINEKEIIEETFKNIPQLKSDVKILNNRNFIDVYGKEQSKELDITLQQCTQSMIEFVNKLIDQQFVIADDTKKQFDEKLEEKRIQAYEKTQNILEVLMKPYNEFLSPPRKINLDGFRDALEESKRNTISKFQQYLSECIQNGENDEPVDKRILYILKIFATVSSKPRVYLQDFKSGYDECIRLITDILQEKMMKLVETRTLLLDGELNMKVDYMNFEGSEKNKIADQMKYEKEETDTKLAAIDSKYSDILKNEQLSQEEKGKFNMEWESEKKELTNSLKKIEKMKNDELAEKTKKFIHEREVKSQQNLDAFISLLLILKKMATITFVTKEITSKIESELKQLNKSLKIIERIYRKLLDNPNAYAGRILDEFAIFNRMNGLNYQEQTKKTNSGEYVLTEMFKKGHITHDQKQVFTVLYRKFEEQQDQWINRYKQIGDDSIINSLITSIKLDGQQFALVHHSPQGQNRRSISSAERVNLLAKIFALWSIIASKEESDDQSEIMICYKAHAAQILCVIIMIGVDQNLGTKLMKHNRLSEVKTGEGKSIVLAVLSIYFALFGYQVHCACYSQILSKRDEQEFSKLINHCGVSSLVHYNIFENIIKKVLNQKNGDCEVEFSHIIKDSLLENQQDMMMNKNKEQFISKFQSALGISSVIGEKPKKILLVDQIDVLFDKSYYGDTFNLAIELKDKTITTLFEFIWKNKEHEEFDYEMVRDSQEFKNVIEKYKTIGSILDNQIYGMLGALSTYQSQQYVIIDKKIMYKVEDSLMDVSYRYNTVYAYLHEFSKGTVSIQAYQEHMSITLCIAEFSFACLPQYYHNVVGVTGTLTCLPKYIKDHLYSKYNIENTQMFPIPSVYGSSTENRKILPSLSVEKEDHEKKIVESIKSEFIKGRPILVFFRNKEELLNFYNSKEFGELQEFASYITEDHNLFERTQRIKNSSMKDTITLMTNSYIRGIDFKLHNKKAKEAGGFHAIVTYLIDAPADYIQATGRVARQGKDGSFIEIFCKEDFELLELDKNDTEALSKVELNRLEKQQKEKDACEQKLVISQERHNETLDVFKGQELSQPKLVEYVLKKNKFPKIKLKKKSKKARIVLLVDATISMDRLFAQLKVFLPTIFNQTYETLEKKECTASIEMQIVLYRNYNSEYDKILEFSSFDSQGDNLKNFIINSVVGGGWGNQAIQVALQYANSLPQLDEIIVIGDARGNIKREMELKRQKYPHLERVRLEKGMLPTCTEDEIEKLKNKKVKVHGFYLSKIAAVREYFDQICQATGGESKFINVSDSKASDDMTEFIVTRGLTLIGGEEEADELISAYQDLLAKKMGR